MDPGTVRVAGRVQGSEERGCGAVPLARLASEWEFQAVTAVLRFKRSALDKKEVESANHSRETLAFVRRVVDLPPFRSWGDDKIVKLRAGQE